MSSSDTDSDAWLGRRPARAPAGLIAALIALATAAAAAALGIPLCDDALAAAGSGSSGFGGGGGGGGSFGSSGGSSGSSDSISSPWVILIIVIVVLIFILPGVFAARRARKRRRERVRRVEAASAEAAEDDPAFASDVVKPAAAKLFRDIQGAWDARDRDALARLVGSDLMIEWCRRLDDFDRKGWHNRVEVIGEPQVEYVGLTNRADDEDDRAVVFMEAKLKDYVVDSSGATIERAGASSTTVSLLEYWTLAKSGERWRLMSIEKSSEGAHHLSGDIVASPWSDEARMRDESLVEMADVESDGAEVNPAELVDIDFADDARAAALDLSIVAPHFAPAILEAAARRAVDAWAQAVDGEDADLLDVATEEAAGDLLYGGNPSGKHRLVVRGPKVKALRIAELDADSKPPTMTVEVDVRGRRYVEDRDTAAVVSGNPHGDTTFTDRWTMSFDGANATAPWRLTGVAK